MSKLTYMDYFVREVLRMHPIATQVVNRQCMEDTHVAGYDIQKGLVSLFSKFNFEHKKLNLFFFCSIRYINSN